MRVNENQAIGFLAVLAVRPIHAAAGLLVALFVAASARGAEQDNAAVSADLVLKSGAIYTVNGARTWAQAVAIRAGHIVYVGTDRGVTAYVTPSTRVVDLKGKMVLPSFQDAHIHPISAGIQANSCTLDGLKTAPEYVAAIKKCADAHPKASWITGGGWWISAFGPGGRARRELIDAVVSDRPVLLSSVDGHTSWANTKALELAKITNQTPDPPDGRIDRDPKTGVAIGSLQEGAADLVSAVVPAPTAEEEEAGLRYAIKLLNGYGITAIQDAAVYEKDLKAYRALDSRGELTLRVVAAIWWERSRGVEQICQIKRAARRILIRAGRRAYREDHAGRRDGELHGRVAQALSAETGECARHSYGAARSPEGCGHPTRRGGIPGSFPRDRRRSGAASPGCDRTGATRER
jgi:predicted amidohydrolase YtcJ